MRFPIIGFDWDDGNLAHCQKHGLSVAEIEAFFANSPKIAPDIKHSDVETRFVAVGRTSNGRAAFVVFAMRGDRIRPLSAQYMHAKEARRYEESTGIQDG